MNARLIPLLHRPRLRVGPRPHRAMQCCSLAATLGAAVAARAWVAVTGAVVGITAVLLLAAVSSAGLELLAARPEEGPALAGQEKAQGQRSHAAAVPPLRVRRPSGPAAVMEMGDESFAGLVFSPDGKRLAGVAADGIWVWDAGTGKRLLTHRGGAVGLSPDWKRLIRVGGPRAGGTPGEMSLWEVGTNTRVRTLAGSAGEGPRRFSPDGKLLAGTEGRADVLTLWEVATGKIVHRLGRKTAGSPVAFSADSTRVAGTDALRLTIWDVATGKEVCRPVGQTPICVAFSPDGKRVAAGSWDRVVWLWDAATGKEVWRADEPKGDILVGSNRPVAQVAFTPDGNFLVTAGHRPHQGWLIEFLPPEHDGEIKVRDAGTGKELFAFRTDVAGVSDMALSPDGTRVAASNFAAGYPVRIWSLIR